MSDAHLRRACSRSAATGFVWGLIAGLLLSLAVVMAMRAWELYAS